MPCFTFAQQFHSRFGKSVIKSEKVWLARCSPFGLTLLLRIAIWEMKEVSQDFFIESDSNCVKINKGNVLPISRFLLFDLERQFSGQSATLVRLQAEQSVEQRQRDIYHSHHHRVFAIAFYMTGNEIEAEEVLQDSFIRAFSKNPEPDGLAIDMSLISELEERLCFGTRGDSLHPDPNDKLSNANVRRTDMEEALYDLPPIERIIFLLRDVEGYPADRIKDLVKLPSAEVLSLLMNGRLRLRRKLAEIAARRQQQAAA